MIPDLTVLTALPFETRVARRLGLTADPNVPFPAFTGRVAGAAIALVETGFRAKRLAKLRGSPLLRPRRGLVSFGLAGGLDPAVSAATVVVPRAVAGTGGERWEADAALVRIFEAAGARRIPLLLASESILPDPAAKEAAFHAAGASAVDMESGVIAAAARVAGVPFAVLRGISDPAGARLPPAVLGAKGALACIRSVPGLVQLAWRAVRARHALCVILRAAIAEIARSD